jgi:hypothetical protein
MARLVALGDSLTQGFQSGAIFQTAWSYPALIARSLGMRIPDDFRVPHFPGSGLPLNIEELLRSMARTLGPDISRLEWFTSFPVLLNRFIDEVEDLYERGAGARPAPFGGVYHNLAVWGFRVADVGKVTSEYARAVINDQDGAITDDFLGLPSAAMYRTAIRVLNPRHRPERERWTMLDNLRQIVAEEGEIESLLIWLGANDCLGTVLSLNVRAMGPDDGGLDPQGRRQFNLTHPAVFAQDFAALVEAVGDIVPPSTNIFVGTIPHVTIPPVTQGIPPFDGTYFAYYGRFFANQQRFNPVWHARLTNQEAQLIDTTIDRFNEAIRAVVATAGPRWRLVDLCDVLDQLAVKRNQLSDAPGRALQDYYARLGITDHPLLRLDPIPSILRLGTRERGERYQGGLFSLDCFHPSTIGYGIVAEAFLREMRAAGVRDADPMRLNWAEITLHDSLLLAPPVLWDDIVEAAESNATLWDVIFRALD